MNLRLSYSGVQLVSVAFNKNILSAVDVSFQDIVFPTVSGWKHEQKLNFPMLRPEQLPSMNPANRPTLELDLNGPREVLQQIPGVKLNEMEHHGQANILLWQRSHQLVSRKLRPIS